jgi:hypothetical protein
MALDIKESEVKAITNECYFAHKPVNPPVVKVPYAQVLVCILMYYLRHKKQKEAEITLLYMAFSGKFYASIFGKYFKTAPPSKYRSTMDYVVNNMLNDRFDLRSKGNLFGAIRSMCISLIEMYGDTLAEHPDDEEIKYFMQQLRDRVNTFMNRIFNLYITAWQDKKYLNYESDNLEDGSEFRISDSDATIAARITENALNYMLNNTVSLKICNMFNDANIRPTELRDIIEAIVNDRKNINQLQRVINILICDFMKKNPNKRVGDVDFLGYCLKEQPNTKDEYIKSIKDIIRKLNQLINDSEKLYKINEDMVNDYLKASANRNYELLMNLRHFNTNNKILDNMNQIINEKNLINKIEKLLGIKNEEILLPLFTIRSNCNENKCIDSKSSNYGESAQIWDYQPNNKNQIFELVKGTKEGFYSIRNHYSGFYLGVDFSTGDWIITFKKKSETLQNFKLVDCKNGFYIIQEESNYAIDLANFNTQNGSYVGFTHKNASKAQQWKLVLI